MLYAKELKQIYCKELQRNLSTLGKYAELLGENGTEDDIKITYNTMENITSILCNAQKAITELHYL